MFGKKELRSDIAYTNKRLATLEMETKKLKNKFNKLLELLGIEEEKYVQQRRFLSPSGFLNLVQTEDTIKTRLVKKETSTEKKETSTGKAPKENEKRTKKERLAYSRGFNAGRRSKTTGQRSKTK